MECLTNLFVRLPKLFVGTIPILPKTSNKAISQSSTVRTLDNIQYPHSKCLRLLHTSFEWFLQCFLQGISLFSADFYLFKRRSYRLWLTSFIYFAPPHCRSHTKSQQSHTSVDFCLFLTEDRRPF